MKDKVLSLTAQKAIEAYGGVNFWLNLETIEAEVSVHGLAFTLKRRPFFKHAKIKMKVQEPVSEITPIGRRPEISGFLNGPAAGIAAPESIMHVNNNARSAFSNFRRNVYWDDSDMAYFANYAFWNYFTLPRLLLREDIQWKEESPGMLKAHFPDTIPTHSQVQSFIFDKDSGLLKQHNYTASIISRFANAANVVKEHSHSDGIPYACRRIVTPASFSGKPLTFPVLIDIQVHSLKYMHSG